MRKVSVSKLVTFSYHIYFGMNQFELSLNSHVIWHGCWLKNSAHLILNIGIKHANVNENSCDTI